MVGCTIDLFNHATDRGFGYTPMLNHDYKSLFKIQSTSGKVLYQKNMAPVFERYLKGK